MGRIRQLVLTNSATEALIQHPRLQHIGFIATAKKKLNGKSSTTRRRSCCGGRKTLLTSGQREHILTSVRQSVAILGSSVVSLLKDVMNTDAIVVHLGVENGQIVKKIL